MRPLSKTETIYIDEAGNTGQDLLNSDQKVFILSSNNFSPSEITTLASIFNNGSEIHFKKLKNSHSGRNQIIQFLNHSLITESNIHSFTAHKEYATVGQIVDQLIEPVLHDIDVDIYQYSENITVSNFIYVFGIHIWDKNIFKKLLETFVSMMRTKTQESISEFYQNVKTLHKSVKTKERVLLELILLSENQISWILSNVNKFTIDLTLPCFYMICDYWFKFSNKKLNIYQDNSKQIEHYQEYITFTQSLNIPNTEVGYGERKMTFPTQIEKLELVSSENHLGVQFSDLIASSIAFMYNNENPKFSTFVEEIKNSKLINLKNNFSIWPNTDVTPEQLKMERGEGQNVLDFLAAHRIKNGI